MLDIVTELLADAGQVLIAHRSTERTIERKSSHWTLVSDADRAAKEYMIDNLRRLAPDDAILSEECGFHPGRSKRDLGPRPTRRHDQLRCRARRQPLDQGAAAVHLQLGSRLRLQLADGGRHVIGEDVFAHCGSVSVVEATYLGGVFKASAMGLATSAIAPQEAATVS
jgi:Inositol monophosphatase family